jgi:S1-C subfamily serine protease
LESQVSGLQHEVAQLQSTSSSTTVYVNGSLNQLYESVKNSIVTIDGLVPQTGLFGAVSYEEVLGSGFVVNLTGTPLIITNYHVIDGMINGSVAFIDGNAYPFTVLGSDPYSDLAVLQPIGVPADMLQPLIVVSSQTLQVGDTVIAVGNPYGLQSTLTSGIVSQLNRAIQLTTTGNYLITGLIQISTPINPGNSGSPLLNAEGEVVGITNAIINGSNNVGFAVPSDAIIREINSLVTTGAYVHPYLGITGVDLDYLIAQAANLNITYGVLIQTVNAGSPAATAGLVGGNQTINVAGNTIYVGGDVIVQINGQPVKTMDDLASYLDSDTIPGQIINVTVIRDGGQLTLHVTLGSRG